MDHQKVFAFLGVIMCASVLAVVSAANTTASTVTTASTTAAAVAATNATVKATTTAGASTATLPGAPTATPIATTTLAPYNCTNGTCNGTETDTSCLKALNTKCLISKPGYGCKVSIADGVVTADCTSGTCDTKANNATSKCCIGAGCTENLFKSKTGNKDNNGNGIQACIATIVTLATVVMAIIN